MQNVSIVMHRIVVYLSHVLQQNFDTSVVSYRMSHVQRRLKNIFVMLISNRALVHILSKECWVHDRILLIYSIIIILFFLCFFVMEILNLFQKHWVRLLEILEDEFEKLSVVFDHIFIISKSRFSIDNIVILLNIKLIIILLEVVVFVMNFSFDDKGHIAERDTDIVSKIQPAVAFVVKSISVMISKYLILSHLFFVLVIYVFYIIACKS
jgi:hypothetical protein